MLREMLPPLFQILTGLSGFALLLIHFKARPALTPLSGRLAALSVVALMLGFFLLSLATGGSSLGAGAELFMAAGAAMFVAVIMLTAGLILSARETQRAPGPGGVAG